jgi:hypothetical protein
VIGGKKAFGRVRGNADCIPCNFAAQMVANGQTPEQVEAARPMMELFLPFLEKTGWCWEDVKASFERRPVIV